MTAPTRIRTRRPCDQCGLPISNAGAHARACIGPLAPADRDLVIRAGAAAATPATLAEPARFGGGVSDVDIARLLLVLDRGTRIILGGTLEWTYETGRSPFHGRLTLVAREAIRTGLAHAREDRLLADPVHARSAHHPMAPACGAPGQLRYRLLGGEFIRLVDCDTCLDTPISGVAYSTDE